MEKSFYTKGNPCGYNVVGNSASKKPSYILFTISFIYVFQSGQMYFHFIVLHNKNCWTMFFISCRYM